MNDSPGNLRDAILTVLGGGGLMRPVEIADEIIRRKLWRGNWGYERWSRIAPYLTRLVREGVVERPYRGQYVIPEAQRIALGLPQGGGKRMALIRAARKITHERAIEMIDEADELADLGQLLIDEFAIDVCEGCSDAGYVTRATIVGSDGETHLCGECVGDWLDEGMIEQ